MSEKIFQKQKRKVFMAATWHVSHNMKRHIFSKRREN
jgi:hypothetical protein